MNDPKDEEAPDRRVDLHFQSSSRKGRPGVGNRALLAVVGWGLVGLCVWAVTLGLIYLVVR